MLVIVIAILEPANQLLLRSITVSQSLTISKMQDPTLGGSSAGFAITVLRYSLYLLVWLLLSAMGGLLAWFLRTVTFDVGIWLQWNPWVVRSVDRWAIFGLGMLWFVYLIGLEGYLRSAVPKHQLWARTKRVLIILVPLLLVAYILQLPLL